MKSITNVKPRNKMLEYTKMILEKVSFDDELFKKEVKKSKMFLQLQEQQILKKWLVVKFGKQHGDFLEEVFSLQKEKCFC